jgi:hypothetical protein
MRQDQNYSNMDYRDVTKPDKISNRCINPLNPTYTVPGEKDEPWFEIGPVDGSSPTLTVNAPKLKNKEHTSLITKDIGGAMAGSKGLGVFANVTRRDGHMSSGLDNSNIHGAQADSLKKCPQTKRQTNPLTGAYQYPGHSEANNDNPYSDPKKKANALTKSGTNQMTSAARQATTPSPAYALNKQPEHKQSAFKANAGAFYGMTNREAEKIDYNKLYNASRMPQKE